MYILLIKNIFTGFIYTFNIQVPSEIKKLAEEKGIVIKPFNVIYHLIADMKVEISNRLPLVQKEDILGSYSIHTHTLVPHWGSSQGIQPRASGFLQILALLF